MSCCSGTPLCGISPPRSVREVSEHGGMIRAGERAYQKRANSKHEQRRVFSMNTAHGEGPDGEPLQSEDDGKSHSVGCVSAKEAT